MMDSQYEAIAQGNGMTVKGHAMITLFRLVTHREIPWQIPVAAEHQKSLHWLALLLLQLPVTERTQLFTDSFTINLIIMQSDHHI